MALDSEGRSEEDSLFSIERDKTMSGAVSEGISRPAEERSAAWMMATRSRSAARAARSAVAGP